jgi:hypothetical protein
MLGYRQCVRTVLVLGALLAAIAPAALAAGPDPTLRLLDASPLTLRGDHFRAGERVFVTLHTTRPYARTVTARANGSFTVPFAGASLHCGRIHASARGVSGDRATYSARPTICTSESIHPPLLPISRR